MKDKKNVLIIAAIFVVVASLLFLVVVPNTLFIIAYIFALIGIAGLVIATFLMLNRKDRYPWAAAFPQQALIYLISEVVISAAIVLLDQFAVWSLPTLWFIVIHAALLALFAIRIIMMRGGAEHIDARGEAVKEKTSFIKSLQADVEILKQQTPDAELKEKLKAYAEKIRYSDPMSATEFISTEAQLAAKTGELKASMDKPEKAKQLILEAEMLLEERNTRCKSIK